ncbi:MAG: hypothetical protein KME05_18140 [Gloeocapsa sp. UFS-A4-WI-NPMV-4B04]|jgi:vacuolar-type H+-ATPase subunit E/Vma4|nr:hypothetical protein [Gloeocapsa sp. UFS-A4-WI-NPMV-4B04]
MANTILLIVGFGVFRLWYCSLLLTVTEAEKILKEHQSEVNQIKKVRINFFDIYVQEELHCHGKGKIMIIYPSEKDRALLKQLLDNTFSKVPYELINN